MITPTIDFHYCHLCYSSLIKEDKAIQVSAEDIEIEMEKKNALKEESFNDTIAVKTYEEKKSEIVKNGKAILSYPECQHDRALVKLAMKTWIDVLDHLVHFQKDSELIDELFSINPYEAIKKPYHKNSKRTFNFGGVI